MSRVRTRFAPSPTGYMHIGNLRTALYGYLYAKKNGGDFVLRIEDTDQERYVADACDVIFSTLKRCGLDWDEGPDKDGGVGPYVQSERKGIYMEYAKMLVESGAAYYCFCTDEQIEAKRQQAVEAGITYKYGKDCLSIPLEEAKRRVEAGEPFTIRQNVPTTGSVTYEDAVFGTITVDCDTLDDMVLIKTDGLPTYNFANVVDDHLMGITHVMRGSEYLSSTPKYTLLYRAFGWEEPTYVHLPLIMKDQHNKLSKRNGDASYQDLIAKGYLSDAVLNYIALLGWNPGTNQEVFTRAELINAFDVSGVSKSPALFDPLKLRWMNGEYIKALPFEEFLAIATPWLDESVAKDKYDYKLIAQLLHTRTEVLSEIPAMVEFLPVVAPHDTDLYLHKKFKLTKEMAHHALILCRDALSALESFDGTSIHDCLIALAADNGLKNGQVLWPARVALSGLPSTPGGAVELAEILGKKETLARLDAAIAMLG